MAEKAIESDVINEDGVRVVDWGTVPSGDTGKKLLAGGWSWTFQRVAGTGTVVVQGSNDGTTFGALHASAGGADISMGDAEPISPLERPLYLRPSVSANSADVIAVGVK